MEANSQCRVSSILRWQGHWKHWPTGRCYGLTAVFRFKEALDIDPAYALAWTGLADGYYFMSGLYLPPREAMPKAKAAAQRALAIDENLTEAHATLAQIRA